MMPRNSLDSPELNGLSGKIDNAASQLRCAIEAGGVDPNSGFSTDEIVDWFTTKHKQTNDRDIKATIQAIMRRNGLPEIDSTTHLRKQVYLRPDQDDAIRLEAAKRKVDQSEIIREALDQYLGDELLRPTK